MFPRSRQETHPLKRTALLASQYQNIWISQSRMRTMNILICETWRNYWLKCGSVHRIVQSTTSAIKSKTQKSSWLFVLPQERKPILFASLSSMLVRLAVSETSGGKCKRSITNFVFFSSNARSNESGTVGMIEFKHGNFLMVKSPAIELYRFIISSLNVVCGEVCWF